MAETKKLIGSILILCFVLVGLLIPEKAYAASNNDFRIENGVLVNYLGSGGDVVIPDNVTSIPNMAFFNNSSITSVTIPDSVTAIGYRAFGYCINLKSVIIPNSVTTISEDAFYSCNKLTSVTIPDGVTAIESCAFYECSSLISVTIPDSVTEIEYSAFSGTPFLDQKRTERNDHLVIINEILIDGEKAQGEITIPDGVTDIGDYAFNRCSSLTGVVIPDSVTNIGDYAFSGCSSLSNVVISDGVIEIGDYAFSGCSRLKEFLIPENVTKLGSAILNGCDSLKKIIILNKEVNLIEINAYNNHDYYYAALLGNTGGGDDRLRIKKPTDTLTICGYKYSTADELAVRLNTMEATKKVFGIRSVKFVPLDQYHKALDAVKVPESITITMNNYKRLSIQLPSYLMRVHKFTKKQGQVKISITYVKETKQSNNYWVSMKNITHDTIKATEKGIGYAYTTVTLPNGDQKVFATEVIVK